MQNLTLGEISIGLGFLVGLVVLLKQVLKPYTDFENRVEKIEKHQDNDNKRLAKLEDDTKQILLSVNTLLSHSIDNNDVSKLRERKSELDVYLIKR